MCYHVEKGRLLLMLVFFFCCFFLIIIFTLYRKKKKTIKLPALSLVKVCEELSNALMLTLLQSLYLNNSPGS